VWPRAGIYHKIRRSKGVIVKRTILVALLLLSFTSARAQDGAAFSAKLDEHLKEAARQGFSGAALISRDGKIIFARGYGLANRELDVPNTAQTKFRLGSITKQFTAVAILLLAERGKLGVQDSVCKFVENCPPAWSPVTIHHLLSHTGGVPSFTGAPDYLPKMMMPETVASMIGRFKDKPLEFAPGEKYNYSNSGYFLLGYVIEKAGGEPYDVFLQKNIFDPLKLTNTGYDRHATILKNRATGYSRGPGGAPVNSAFIDMSQPYAAGSLYSTVEDLFAWNEALFSGKLLSPKSFEQMITPVKNNYGYGIGTSTMFNRKVISHGGGINGFNTTLMRFPEEKLTVTVLRNVDFGDPNPGRIAQGMVAIVLGEKIEQARERAVAKIDLKVYDAYVGEYELVPNFTLTVTREGDRLMVQATGQNSFEIFPESETKFFVKVIEAQVTFVKDASGKVTHLILHQGGDREAKKIK
jgi:CubicO group peptidase (beta-lactamase class C family)